MARKPGPNGTHPIRIKAAQRRIDAMRLRLQGYQYKEIAEQLGCSTQRAHAIVQEEFAKLRAEQHELTENMLRLDSDRIESLMKVWFPKAQRGDVEAGEMVLKLLDRRARLLGLNAPKKTEGRLEVSEASEAELQATARIMGISVEDCTDDDAEAGSGDSGRRLQDRPADRGRGGLRAEPAAG